MISSPRFSKAVLVSSAAIIAFFLSLTIAGHRFIQIEHDLESGFVEDMSWMMAQVQLESLKFTQTLARFVSGYETVTKNDLNRSYDILASRLALFKEGEPKRFLSQVGVLSSLNGHLSSFEGVAQDVEGIARGDRNDEAVILYKLQPLFDAIRDAGNQSMLAGRAWEAKLRDERRWKVLEIMIYMCGVLGSGIMLVGVIIRSRREIALAEETLRKERDLSRMYRMIVSIVSDQFRTPLAIIDSSAQRIRRRGTAMDGEEIRERTEHIRHAISSLSQLMDNTLDSARIDAGEIDFRPRTVDLAGLIEAVCERFEAEETDRTVTIDLSHVPKAVICDPALIEQAFFHIFGNALKFSDKSQPIHVRSWSDAESVEILVEDFGIGIPEDEVDRVFDLFFRARTAEAVAGIGIGLSFTREVARLHGGNIEVKSSEGVGSTFTLRLPLRGLPRLAASRQPDRANLALKLQRHETHH